MTTVQKIRSEPDVDSAGGKSSAHGQSLFKENKGEFMKLLAKESGVHDPVVAGLIHEEIVKLYLRHRPGVGRSDAGVHRQFQRDAQDRRGRFHLLKSRISASPERQWAS